MGGPGRRFVTESVTDVTTQARSGYWHSFKTPLCSLEGAGRAVPEPSPWEDEEGWRLSPSFTPSCTALPQLPAELWKGSKGGG